MKICFPVAKDKGLDSPVFTHFGSAPMFLLVDAEQRSVAEVVNRDRNHQHGACRPLRALGGQQAVFGWPCALRGGHLPSDAMGLR